MSQRSIHIVRSRLATPRLLTTIAAVVAACGAFALGSTPVAAEALPIDISAANVAWVGTGGSVSVLTDEEIYDTSITGGMCYPDVAKAFWTPAAASRAGGFEIEFNAADLSARNGIRYWWKSGVDLGYHEIHLHTSNGVYRTSSTRNTDTSNAYSLNELPWSNFVLASDTNTTLTSSDLNSVTKIAVMVWIGYTVTPPEDGFALFHGFQAYGAGDVAPTSQCVGFPTMRPLALSVTASSPSVRVGDSVSPSVAVSSGFLLWPDAIGSATFTYEGTNGTTYGPSTTAPTEVGTYSVTPSALTLSSGDISNYNVTYVAGTLTIAAAQVPITVAASSPSATVGDSVSPSVSVSSGSLASGDAIGSATFTYEGTGDTTYGPSTTAPTEVGTYSVTPSALTLASGDISNYDVTYVAGTLTIAAAPSDPESSTTVPATTTTVATPSVLVAPDGAVLFDGVGPELEPGTGEILEGDSWEAVSARSSEVGSELVRDENEVVLQPVNDDGSPVTDDDFEIRLSGDCSGADCSIETVTDANGVSREVMRLQTVDGVARATGSGFQPGTEVKLWLFSDPVSLGTATVASDGTFTVDVPLDGVTPGEHTLQANGVTADLKARTAHVGVVLDPSSTELPATGGSSSPVVWAVLVVSLGLIVMLSRRRPQVASSVNTSTPVR